MGRLIGRGGNSVGACGGFGAHGGSLPRGGVALNTFSTARRTGTGTGTGTMTQSRRRPDASYLLSLSCSLVLPPRTHRGVVSTIQTPRAASSDNLGDPPPRRLSRQYGVLRPISPAPANLSSEQGRVGSRGDHRGGRPTGPRSRSRSLSPGRDNVVVAGRSDAASDESRIQVSDVVDYFINLPWQKLSSWLLVLAVASQLKEFLGITMGTFIVSFIGNSFVSSFQRLPQLAGMSPQKRRRVLVGVYYTGIGTWVVGGRWCWRVSATSHRVEYGLARTHALTRATRSFVRSFVRCSSSLYIIRRADYPGRGA